MRKSNRFRVGVVIGLALVAQAALGCESSPGNPNSGNGPPAGGDGGTIEEAHSTFQSGSRLRARVQQADGGAALFLGWEDTKAKQDCEFHPAEDGQIRCLPLTGQGTSIQYLDDACTLPVAVRTCGASDRYAVSEIAKETCSPADVAYTAYEVGDKLDDAPTFAMFNGNCIPVGPASPGTELHAAKKIPATLFVGAAVVNEPHGDRLSAEVLKGDDGSRQIRAIRDKHYNSECDPRMDDLGSVRCAPAVSPLGGGNFFEDPACARPLLADIGSPASCPAPRFAEAPSEPSVCSKGFRAVEVGKKVSSMTVFQGAPNLCQPAAFLPPDWSFYEVGPALDPASLPVLAVQADGKGRLRVPGYMAPDGAPLAQSPKFLDTQGNQTCVPRRFADGKTRCVPDDVPRFNLFSDAACTTPLAAVPKDAACPAPAPKLGLVVAPPADPMCAGVPVVQELHEIGGPWSGSIVYSKAGSSGCAGLDPSQINVDIYEIGKAVDPSVLAEVHETTE